VSAARCELRMTSTRLVPVLLLVALVSFASLCLEVTLTRLFSVVFYYHFTFLTLSVAFIGASGAGIIAWLLGERVTGPRADGFFGPAGVLAGVAMLALLPLLKSAGFYQALVEGNALALIPALLLITLPYFMVSLVLCIAFARNADRIGTVYGVDLVAAAAGCLLFPLVIRNLGGASTVLFCGVIVILGSVMLPFGTGTASRSLGMKVGKLALAAAALSLLVYSQFRPDWEIKPRVARDVVGGPQIERRWSSVSSLGVFPLAGSDGDDYFLLIDSLYGTPLMTETEQQAQVDAATGTGRLFTAPFELLEDRRSIAILGAGAGVDMLRARTSGFDEIAGIEVNPEIVNIVREGTYSTTMNELLATPGVTYARDEARAWLAARGQNWQVIQIPWIESRAAVMGGALNFSENLLFTIESFRLYLSHLDEDGILMVHRYSHASEAPLQMLRLVTLMAEVVDETTRQNLSQHIMVSALDVDQMDFGAFVFSRRPLTPEQVARYSGALTDAGHRVDYAPGFTTGNPYLRQALASEQERRSMLLRLRADVQPTTDDRPYFFRTTLPFGEDRTNNEISGILGAVGLLSIIFLGLPLVRVGRGALKQAGSWKALIYFAAIGYGFMGVEIGLIHRLTLLLGRPETSLIIVLAVILLFSGLGSYLSPRMAAVPMLSVRRSSLALCLLATAVLVGFAPMAHALEASPFALRVVVACVMLAPFGLLMGTFFPRAVSVLEQRMPSLIPWAWAMNGLASVAGSATTLYLSLNLGATVAMVPAVIAYGLVAFATLEE
jgi:hypothetical protein